MRRVRGQASTKTFTTRYSVRPAPASCSPTATADTSPKPYVTVRRCCSRVWRTSTRWSTSSRCAPDSPFTVPLFRVDGAHFRQHEPGDSQYENRPEELAERLGLRAARQQRQQQSTE